MNVPRRCKRCGARFASLADLEQHLIGGPVVSRTRCMIDGELALLFEANRRGDLRQRRASPAMLR